MLNIKRKISYWWWRFNQRTTVMPLGHGVTGVVSMVMNGTPMIAMVPLTDKQMGEPGGPVEPGVIPEFTSIDELPRGSVVLAFKDEDAIWHHRAIAHRLWADVVNARRKEN